MFYWSIRTLQKNKIHTLHTLHNTYCAIYFQCNEPGISLSLVVPSLSSHCTLSVVCVFFPHGVVFSQFWRQPMLFQRQRMWLSKIASNGTQPSHMTAEGQLCGNRWRFSSLAGLSDIVVVRLFHDMFNHRLHCQQKLWEKKHDLNYSNDTYLKKSILLVIATTTHCYIMSSE